MVEWMQLSLPNLKAAIAVSLKRLKKVVDSLFYLQLRKEKVGQFGLIPY